MLNAEEMSFYPKSQISPNFRIFTRMLLRRISSRRGERNDQILA